MGSGLHDLGFTTPPHHPTHGPAHHRAASPGTRLGTAIGKVNRDVAVDVALFRLGARRSSWNAADIRGEIERIITSVNIVATTVVRAGSPKTSPCEPCSGASRYRYAATSPSTSGR